MIINTMKPFQILSSGGRNFFPVQKVSKEPVIFLGICRADAKNGQF